MSKYKLIQFTNSNIGAIPANGFIPVGLISRRVNTSACNCNTFSVSSSNADSVYLNEPGSYKVTYVGSFNAAAEGDFSVSLIANGVSVITSQETVTAAEDMVNITLVYVMRVCPNCCSAPANCPMSIQMQLGTGATSATDPSVANLIIEKIA